MLAKKKKKSKNKNKNKNNNKNKNSHLKHPRVGQSRSHLSPSIIGLVRKILKMMTLDGTLTIYYICVTNFSSRPLDNLCIDIWICAMIISKPFVQQ